MPKFTFTPVPLEAAPSSSSSLEVEVRVKMPEMEIRELKGEVVEVKSLMTATMLEANSNVGDIKEDTKLLPQFPLTSFEQLKEVKCRKGRSES
ncbi:hypothetical protein M5D96_014032 [Drosophila gunungcola]|uniref:Uncharacterized protein n=1 Tax=Drosophila gunungcola TaxID=103775 RepID=A0A9Q0BIT7_9MUSC|nr:hypothetical protein M5D96_014032 [Drosophila gunungcola]